jgi:hypothetical protein
VLFSPELDQLKTQITKNILRESEDFFDPPEDLEVLGNTVRIACEFFLFLKRTDGLPDLEEAEYITGTIRSGIEDFHRMEQWGRILTGLELRRGFSDSLPTTLPELKKLYDSIFEQLIHCASSAKGVGLLLSLAQMMLLFMTAYFQTFLSFSGSDSNP